MASRYSRRRLLAMAASLAPGLRAAEEAGRFEGKGLWRTTPLDISDHIGYFIDSPNLGAEPGDEELACWALAAWEDALQGLLCFTPKPAKQALMRVYWGQTGDRLGQMHAIEVGDLRGAEVYVDPFADRFDQQLTNLTERDPLFRDTTIFRTLLHEIGHGLGLVHTVDIDDTMYFGGDYVGYYRRYRETVSAREDLRFRPGLSAMDLERLRGLYPESIAPTRRLKAGGSNRVWPHFEPPSFSWWVAQRRRPQAQRPLYSRA